MKTIFSKIWNWRKNMGISKQAKKKELENACKNADIDKLIELLEGGADPNTRVEVWVTDSWSSGPESYDCSHYEERTLLDISDSEAVRKLLRAFGAKTIAEIHKEERIAEEARSKARQIEYERKEAIRRAEKKAKAEADMRKVDAFLALS